MVTYISMPFVLFCPFLIFVFIILSVFFLSLYSMNVTWISLNFTGYYEFLVFHFLSWVAATVKSLSLYFLPVLSLFCLVIPFCLSPVALSLSVVMIVFSCHAILQTVCICLLVSLMSFKIFFFLSNISFTLTSTTVFTLRSVQSSFWFFVSLHVLYSVVCIYFSLVCQSINEFPFHWASCNLSRAFVTIFSAAFLNREDTGLCISSKSRPENIVAITVSGWYLTYYLIQIS